MQTHTLGGEVAKQRPKPLAGFKTLEFKTPNFLPQTQVLKIKTVEFTAKVFKLDAVGPWGSLKGMEGPASV